ncbi:MAG: hypothetical protein HC774_01595, partial [Sphingomonadales bacterium]|nr:hypothetical protein [Sphingomonadales bacterium]
MLHDLELAVLALGHDVLGDELAVGAHRRRLEVVRLLAQPLLHLADHPRVAFERRGLRQRLAVQVFREPRSAHAQHHHLHGRRRRLLGLGATLLAAFFVSLITTFARIAYDSGSDPATQVFLRSLCMMLALGGLQLALRRPVMVPRRVIPTTIAFGLCILMMSFGYLSSVA